MTRSTRHYSAFKFGSCPVWNQDKKITLGINEWSLLLVLAQADGRVDSKELLVSAWGQDYAAQLSFLKIWIQRLRVNLGDDPQNPTIVLGTVEQGFRLAS